MILYNTTFVYDRELHKEVSQWIRETWLPGAIAAGMELPLCASIPPGDDCSMSVAVQGRFVNDGDAEAWHDTGGVDGLKAMYLKYGERVLAFSTLMEVFEP